MASDFAVKSDCAEIEISLARSSDEALFMEMRLECLRDVYGFPESFCFDVDLVAKSRKYFLCGDHATVFALDGNGECAGVASLCFIDVMPTFEHPARKRAHFMNVYVRAEARRRGIGKKMVARLIEEARARGATEITLDATEEGRLLYESLGFAENKEAMSFSLR
ncbi:MAG: GNAT family N-acetyltransferase [Treponema sp.]|nr:GNAT family N-acetyltransferase [Treponema sp.]